ncbi:MAG: Ig-like domain-containing protein [Candidatus Zixiibacteriota bacterium]
MMFTKYKILAVIATLGLIFTTGSAMAQTAPVVSDIPDQTVAEGLTFTTINLDDYVTDAENTDDQMTWTYAGNLELTVDITARIATITIPTVDWNGNETITFTATDPDLLFDSDPAIFTVTAVNDAPVVSGIPDESIAEGGSFATINLDDYVTDADNLDTEMLWSYSGNTNLTVDITARVATITPISAEWNGTETITFTAEDPSLATGFDAADFTVTPVGDPPIVSDIPDETIIEGSTFATINLDDYVTDIDNTDAEIIWTYSGNIELAVSIDVNRVATISIPNADWNGAETITFTATDTYLLSNSNPATFTVTPVNDAPVVSGIPDQTVAEGASFATINLDDYVTDVDNLDTEMLWSYSGNVELFVTINASRIATITIPSTEWSGSETISFMATDPSLMSAIDPAVFTVTPVNDAPVVTDIPDQTIPEGASFATINLDDFVSDIDNTDAEMTWSYAGNIELTVDITARVATITIPTPDWNGTETITFTAEDLGLLSDSDPATFTVTAIGDSPVVSDIPNQSITEGSTFATITLDDYVSDIDNLDSEITWSYSGNSELTVDITARVATITIPDADWVGTETITFTATDPGFLSDFDAADFTVTNINDAPVVAGIPDESIAEGSSFAVINLDDYVTDVDNLDTEMTWTYSGNTNLTVDITARVATITPISAEWNGTETITFTAEDPGLATGFDAADFTVTPVNDAPVVIDIPDQTISEGGAFTTINLDAFVSDIDNTDAEMNWTYSGNIDLIVSIDLNRIATIDIPSPDWNGNETITFTATDPGLASGADAVVFTATNVNDAPVVADIPNQTIIEGSLFTTINLDDYVNDIDNADDELTWSYSGNTELSVDITARVATITMPTPDWNGTETITFTATDQGLLSDSDPVIFTVTPVNDAPIVSDIPNQTVVEGDVFTTINLDDYVSDVDNTDTEMTWSYSGNVELTVDITARVATISIPTAEWNGTETITFTAEDPGFATDSDPATFTVTAVGDAPVVTDIPDQSIAEGASFTTINLDDFVSDADNTDAEMTWSYSGNTELIVDITTRVATITTPGIDWNGSETITFTASDPGLLTGSDPATFTATAVNDAPVVLDIPDQTVLEGDVFTTINLDDYVSDVDNTDAEMTWSYSGSTELIVDITARVATITIPTAEWNGNETITFTAEDPGLATGSDPATFTVTPVNDAPVVTDIPDQAIVEGASFATINLDDFVSDIDNLDTEITWSYSGYTELTVDITARVATITTPTIDWNGSETITFTASDPGLLTGSDPATFTVTPINDAPIVSDIPDQTVLEGDVFTTINLDDYVSDVDNTDAEMTWSYSGSTELIVDITARVATISIPTAEWNGNETITFTAEDPDLAIGSDPATFTVTAVNDAPVVLDIPDQTVREGDFFTTINLDDYVSDVDNLDTEMIWSYSGNIELIVDITARVATITIPTAEWNGSETITFTAEDPGLATGSDPATFTVTAVGDAPVVTDIPDQSIAEGASFTTINLDDFVSDADNTDDEMTWSYSGNTELIVDITARVATITTPTIDWNGSETITFTASDPGLLTGSDPATFTVTPINDAPIVSDIPDQTVAEGASFITINLDDYVSDVDNTDAEMTWSYSGSTELIVDITARVATISIPTAEWNGTETITFTAEDPDLEIGSDPATFTVSPVNDAPVLTAIGPQTVAEGGNLNLIITATDADGTIPTLATSALPANATFDNLTGIFDFNPDFTQGGDHFVTFYAADGLETDSELVQITVTELNQPPVLDPIGAQTVAEGGNLNLIITASDADGTVPTLSTSTLPTNATFDDLTGIFDFNPDFAQAGDHFVTFYADDGVDIDSEIVQITVTDGGNQAPVLDPIGAQIVYENSNLNFEVTASDPDGPAPTLSATGFPANATFDDLTGIFDFNPNFTQEGVYNVTFKAFDGFLVDSEVVIITVLNTNRPPVLDPIATPQAVNEGENLNFVITASDPDGTTPTLSTSALPPNATFEALTGIFDFTPAFDQAGSFDITFFADDGSESVSQLVTINVADAGNQAPVLNAIGPLFVTEGTNLNVLITAVDPDGTIPTFTVINLPVNSTFNDNLDGTGIFDFTPDFTQAGVYGVTFIISDGVLADSEFVLVSVTELGNQAPVLDPIISPRAVNENDTLIIPLSATDPDGHNVVFSYTSNQPMTGITLTDNLNGTGVFMYAPDFNSAGVDTIRIYATDDGSPQLSDIALVEIITIEINQPPSIEPIGPFGVSVGRTLEFTVTASDSTTDGSGQVFLTASGIPNNATFVDQGDNTGLFRFTPNNSQAGVLTVRFIAIDDSPSPMSASIDVEITVVSGNAPPEFADIMPQMIPEGQTLVLMVSASDPDGGIPILSADDLTDSSSFIDNLDGTGTFTFSPTFVMAGLYGIVLRASDGFDIDRVNVLIQVLEAGNQAPILDPIPAQNVTEAIELVFAVSVLDPDETIPTLTAEQLPSGATFSDNGDGTANFSWMPGYTQSGIYDILVIASDGELADSQLVTIIVDDAGNQMPVLDPISSITVNENATIRFDVTCSDLDLVVPILSTSTLPGTATFVDNGNYTGRFEWITSYTDAGTYDLTFYATDADDGTMIDSVIIQIVINDVNRLPYLLEIPPGQTKTVAEGGTLVYNLSGFDPDGIPPRMVMVQSTANFNFVDNGNGTATLTLTPNYTQAGIYALIFAAYDNDPSYPDDFGIFGPINFTVTNVPVAPILEPIGPQTVVEGETLDVLITATNPGGGNADIIVQNNPTNSEILFSAGMPKTFRFTPNYVQAGTYNVLFIALKDGLADSEYVSITVQEAGNQAPIFTSPTDTMTVILGESIEYHILAIDPDLDPIFFWMINPPPNSVLVDSGNGAASLTFTPDASQNGAMHLFRYVVEDPAGLTDTLLKWTRVATFLRGDANNDETVNIADAIFIVNFVFKQGAAPVVMEAADVNNDGVDGPIVNIGDALYLVNFIFKQGPPPINN